MIKSVDFQYKNDITVVSEKQFSAHKKLYEGYVTKANEIAGLLKNDGNLTGNATYSPYRALKKGQSYALDGITLHELYFNNIGEGKDKKPCDKLVSMLIASFGSYERWLADFKACALSARGWAILAYEQRSKSLTNILLDTHDDGNIVGAHPVLILDMYEHAYFIDYASNKEEYFNKFIENIDWDTVNGRVVF